MQVGDIIKHRITQNHFLIISKVKVIIDGVDGAFSYRYRCLDLFNGGHVLSFLPHGLYKKVA
jgi:hypothetical protein